MTAWATEEGQRIFQDVQAKAATDAQFRQQMLIDPRAAIKTLTGKVLPAEWTLQVIEADPTADMIIVLPPLKSRELSEKDMDGIAGGAPTLPPAWLPTGRP